METTRRLSPQEAKMLAELEELERQESERQEALQREASLQARKRWQLTRERLIVDKKGSYRPVMVQLEKSGSGNPNDLSDDFGLLGRLKKMGGDGPGLVVHAELDRALIGMYNEKLPKDSSKRIKEYSILTDVNGRTSAEAMLTELVVASKASLKFLVPTPKSVEDAYFLSRSAARAQGRNEEAKAQAVARSINDDNIHEHVKGVLMRTAASRSMRHSSVGTPCTEEAAAVEIAAAAAADEATEATPEEKEAAAAANEEREEDEEAKAKSELMSLMMDPSNALLLQELFATSAASKAGSGISTVGSWIEDFQPQAGKDSESDGGFFSSLLCWRKKELGVAEGGSRPL